MLKIGLIINPIAGLGGPAALKGSDGSASKEAIERGFEPQAEKRVVSVLRLLFPYREKFIVYTCSGSMGVDACVLAGVNFVKVHQVDADDTSAADTQRAAVSLAEVPVDILLFAGGDGMARDICASVGSGLLVLGVPSGVKMHSGVFAITPEAAADLLIMLLMHELVSTMISQVRDLDESELRAGQVKTRFYGEMLTPCEGRFLQNVKCSSVESETLVLADIAAYVVESMEAGITYAIGSGSTTKAIKDELGVDGSLLGVDVILQGELIAKDVDEKQLYDLVCNNKVVLYVTLIGGQGHVFGRGNQQLSPRVIRAIGSQNIHIVAARSKLKTLEGRPMVCDTGDADLDDRLSGFKTIITGYDDSVIYPLGNPAHFNELND